MSGQVVPASVWEEHFASGGGFRRADPYEMALLRAQVRPRAGQRALDVGCGLGGYAAGLAALGYTTTAIDWAASSVAAVRDRYEGLGLPLDVRRVDFEDARSVRQLPERSYDLVTMRLVYAFLRRKAAVAERVRRLLAPGGAWVVTTPLASRLPPERRIGITERDLGVLIGGWGDGRWYDLEPAGLRVLVLRGP
ncbi:class I SAM-dependent methyltransferase [Streptomyces sp. NPDC001904]|uniref:class I SAM-dependent methyltransferase n=1 Tax=Streptomyces sp. NPDC001904 TaxID=3154531 RepID=UPI003327F0CE